MFFELIRLIAEVNRVVLCLVTICMILIYIYNNNFDTQNQLKNIKKNLTDKFYDAQ
jgi:uncharacterized membrane protein